MKKLYYGMIAIFVCFFIFSFKLLAATKPYLTIDYDSDFISRNHKSEFFGENGYLERVRKVLVSGNVNLPLYAIYFSKNDLCVESYKYEFTYQASHGYSGWRTERAAISYNYYYLDGKFYVTNLVSKKSKKLCLSDYADIDGFIESLTNFDSLAKNFSSNVNVINSVDVSIEKLNTNFDYFDLGFTDYYIRYYDNLDSDEYVENIFWFERFDQKDSFSDYTSISNYYSSNINSHSSSYYYKKGYNEPTFYYIKSLDGLVSKDNLTTNSFTAKFYSNIKPNLKFFRILGKKEFDSGYYWVDLSPGKHEEYSCAADYESPTYENGFYTLKFNIATCSNVEEFSEFYIQAAFDNNFSASAVSFTGSNTLFTFINDVSYLVILDRILFSWNTSTIFSSSIEEYTGFYYSEFVDTGVDGRVTSVSVIDLSTKKHANTLNVGREVNTSIGKLRYMNVPIGTKSNFAYYTLMINRDTTLHAMINYLYNPVDFTSGNPIFFVSTGELDNDNILSASYIDKDNNIHSVKFDAFGSYTSSNYNVSSISSFFSNAFAGAGSFIDCSIEILSLVNGFFVQLPSSVKSLLLVLFTCSLIYIFVRFIK